MPAVNFERPPLVCVYKSVLGVLARTDVQGRSEIEKKEFPELFFRLKVEEEKYCACDLCRLQNFEVSRPSTNYL